MKINRYFIETLAWLAENEDNQVDYRGEWIVAGGDVVCGGEASWQNVEFVQAMYRGGVIAVSFMTSDRGQATYIKYAITDWGRESLRFFTSAEYVEREIEQECIELDLGTIAIDKAVNLFKMIREIYPNGAIQATGQHIEYCLRELQQIVHRHKYGFGGYLNTLFRATNYWLIAHKQLRSQPRKESWPLLGLTIEG